MSKKIGKTSARLNNPGDEKGVKWSWTGALAGGASGIALGLLIPIPIVDEAILGIIGFVLGGLGKNIQMPK